MGYLDRNNCSCNNGKKQPLYINPERVAEQVRKQERRAMTGAIATTSVFTLLGLTAKVIDSGNFKLNSKADGGEPRTVEEIKADIDKILGEIDVTTISEAETTLASRPQAEQAKKDLETAIETESRCSKKISSNNTIIANCEKQLPTYQKIVDTYPDQIKALEAEIVDSGNNNDKVQQLQNELEIARIIVNALNKKKGEAEKENNELEKQKQNAIAIKNKSQEFVNQTANIDYDKLETLVNNLHTLEKELKKAKDEEAKNSLASYQNENSENITDILDKLKNCRNDKQKDKYTQELKDALQNYVNSGKDTNPTLNNLAKLYGIEKK